MDLSVTFNIPPVMTPREHLTLDDVSNDPTVRNFETARDHQKSIKSSLELFNWMATAARNACDESCPARLTGMIPPLRPDSK